MKTKIHPDHTSSRSRPSPRIGVFLTFLATLLVGGFAAYGQAVESPPKRLSYQGYLTDVNGTPLANSAPQNYTIIFRIYDAEETGTLKWTESQTVTVDNGSFSVVLGEGSVHNSEARPDLDTVFDATDASERYVGITVIPSGQSTGNELEPRLQLVTSPYAFLASKAMTAKTADQADKLSSGATDLITYNSTDAKVVIAGKSDLNGNTTVGGTLSATGKATLTGGLAVTGTTDVDASAGIGALQITVGTATMRLDENEIQSVSDGAAAQLHLNNNGGGVVLGSTTAATSVRGSTVSVSGDTEITGTKTLTVGGLATMNDDLIVKGTQNSGVTTPGILEVREGADKILRLDGDEIQSVTAGNVARQLYLNNGGGDIQLGSSSSKVGIGTAAPQYPLEVDTTLTKSYNNQAHLHGDGISNPSGSSSFSNPVSARFKTRILVDTSVVITSDSRIKDIADRPDGRDALDALNQIQIVDYRMRDSVAHGSRVRRGVVAQEVEKVVPTAVSKSVDYIPDVYQGSESIRHDAGERTLTIRLSKPHGLQAGANIKLISDDAKEERVIVRIPGPRELVVGDWPVPVDRIFVYGQRVNDFRTVDYDQIFTTGIAAIQEVNRRLEASNTQLRSELVAVTEANAKLSGQLAAILERVQALESLAK